MKTNHRRNFKETRDPRAVFARYIVGGNSRRLELSDREVSAYATCTSHTNGKRGIARDKRGAKKYVRSRARFHEHQALARLIRKGGWAQEALDPGVDSSGIEPDNFGL
ncbi:hypothetical protein RBE51_20925 [Pseudomonas taiwanensis]|uniref:hypothetical protein n=1 Tax=Pseudomonas taiwanensis TaxID=470150 RepID=UPI0028DFBD27|nr:hypothetical protein [Pseudomonas taiwanensis]MDT8925261.1 hypothetical protein [Pseudomonas taiwanensis]